MALSGVLPGSPAVSCRDHWHSAVTSVPVSIGNAVDSQAKEAARTRTCLEVNSNFHRLDLNDVHCRKARDLGVHVIINTDSHNYDDLLNLRYGVATAQRGWIEKDRVLNAKPVEEMLAFKSGN